MAIYYGWDEPAAPPRPGTPSQTHPAPPTPPRPGEMPEDTR